MGTFGGGVQVANANTWTGLQTFDAGIDLGANTLQFEESGHTIKGTTAGGAMVYDVPTGDVHIFDINSVGQLRITSTELDLTNNILRLGSAEQTITIVTDDMEYDVPTNNTHRFRVNNATEMELSATALDLQTNNLTLGIGSDIILATSTGTKIGTGTTQLLAFWDSTPVVQPGHIANPTDLASAIVAIDAILADLAELGLQAAS